MITNYFDKPFAQHLVRRIPDQFSWIDHRLVREQYIDYLSSEAAALYLFLVTVSDAQGLSYYGRHIEHLKSRVSTGELALPLFLPPKNILRQMLTTQLVISILQCLAV